MRKGERLVCKQEPTFIKDPAFEILKVGHSYEIIDIIKDDDYPNIIIRINDSDWYFSEFNVEKYFHTKQEARKLKLKKLDGI
jgi:hypothetical protein